jgi:hypothetical protein
VRRIDPISKQLLLGGLLRSFHRCRRLGGRELVFTELLAPITVCRLPRAYVDPKPLSRGAFAHSLNRCHIAIAASTRDALVLRNVVSRVRIGALKVGVPAALFTLSRHDDDKLLENLGLVRPRHARDRKYLVVKRPKLIFPESPL